MVNPQEAVMPYSKNDTSTRWREAADNSNPAGPLFGSEYASADIVCETGTTSGYCGTVCTWSYTRQCC
jgi:hypothetical protein